MTVCRYSLEYRDSFVKPAQQAEQLTLLDHAPGLYFAITQHV